MIVYIYSKKENKKIITIKGVHTIVSAKDEFLLNGEEGIKSVEKKNIKLVVYGF